MSTPDFQLALARLIASPELCREVIQSPDAFFEEYHLEEKEKRRIQAVLKQKGFSACCSLYRMNRITPLYTQLSNTSTLLGDDLIPLVEDFWNFHKHTSLQFKEEVIVFADFLLAKIITGELNKPYLKEILLLEKTMNELSYLPEGEKRVLFFDYDIYDILYYSSQGSLQNIDLPAKPSSCTLYLENQELKIE